jgi:hypothetical protein
MSKGSSKRPLSVPKKEFEDNWNKIFNKSKSKKIKLEFFMDLCTWNKQSIL